MTTAPLKPDDLRRRCDPAAFDFDTTADLPADLSDPPGQERARAAVEFGVGVRQDGYNLFVVGSPGVGRRTLVTRMLGDAPPPDGALHDWCYVNCFENPQRPQALGLPAGRGTRLRDDLAQWLEELREAIPAAFDTDEYRERLGHIDQSFNERQQQAFGAIGERSAAEGIALLRTPSGFSFAPLSGTEIMSPDEFGKLPTEKQRALADTMHRYETELEAAVRQVIVWRRERADSIRALNEEVVEFAVGRLTTELRHGYEDLPEVATWLDAAKADVIEHVDQFRKPGGDQPTELAGMMMKPEADFTRYQVNLVISNDPDGGAPIILEDHPTYSNLVGRVEHVSQLGALVTNFGLIRAGALHRANGGFLLVDAERLLTQPYAWEGLKRALRTREIRIDSLGQIYSLVSTLSLEPQPIPLQLKVVMFGPRYLYALLQAWDPDFGALFKVAAEFTEDVTWTPDALSAHARLVAGIGRQRGLRPFARDAVAAIAEECARMADDASKLSVHVRSIEELMQEGDYWAHQAGRHCVTAEDIARGVHERIERTALTRDRLQEAVLRGVIMVDTDGEAVGRVNGLAVYSLGPSAFALPQRITATTRVGKGEVVDIQREVSLSGAIHSKGVLTLASFLAARFGRLRPLSLAATLSFEQSYGMVDGDSASVAELCALLSSIAGVPIRQSIAITGSTNQHGQVQAIGGVNEKIEGFHAICKARGLTGRHAVIIPAANREHLMLRDEVVASVRDGAFAIYAVSHVDEALELLTGLPAGREDTRGGFPRSSVNARVVERLAQFDAAGQSRGAIARVIADARRRTS